MYDADSLTHEQLAGQRLMVGFEGKVLDDDLRFMIRDLRVGGLILFKRNVSDPFQVAELCEAAQAYAVDSGNPSLIIAIDQEGGPVARLGPPFTVFPGNRAIGAARSEQSAREFGTVTARELRGVGINMNFAPVLDVAPPGFDSVMADRVFGEDPELVAFLGKTVITGLQDNGMPATAKHFPGIGRTTLDSHADLPYLDTERQILDETDLVPFRVAVTSGVEAVMLSHVVYKALDAEWPASLSAIVAKDLLRDKMGFEGITITDDLDMGAIEKHFDIETAVRRILDAEVDIALICHNRQKMERAHQALVEAVGESEESRQKTSASVQRILNLKQKYLGNA
ncbi:MAG: beta-N-acetylhexosaminidase [Deltaproteobacteria bacterium]|nr:beta-N-acetylhexosaminidase [Deltaproteobacteria bacterium]